MFHVAADDISFAATFFKSHLSLILSRLLSKPNPLRRVAIRGDIRNVPRCFCLF